ncbi:MFS family permease [Lactobacillus colini]|uniref:MFS family permease n=1 Tax=Lactobacillus colini TaxID=1819254 RepID=A0ABS4MB29_9LACO|nr:MFS transporter [Lactobacillus colini]MBP2056870.1 MFS family permease [Lactobacillus colini]
MEKKYLFRISVIFLILTGYFTLFRSTMSGVFTIFYSTSGISDAQIGSIKSFQNIGIMLGMLPAGYISDKFGRLKVLTLSSCIISFSFLLLVLFRSYLSFSCAEFIYGIGLALNSGTLLAYITELQEEYSIEPDKKLMGMQVIVLNITVLVGGNIGTWLFDVNHSLPIWFSTIGLFLYPIGMYSLIKYMNFSDNKSKTYAKKVNEYSFIKLLSFIKNRKFWILLLLNIGYDCGTQFVLIYWSIIYVKNLHFNLTVVYTLFMCAFILGTIIFSKIIINTSLKRLLLVNTLCIMVALILSGMLTDKYILLILFLIIELIMGIMSGQISATSNLAIYGENNKSIMLSVVSFVAEILVSISLFINDLLVKISNNVNILFWVSACYFIILLFVVPLVHYND